MTFKLTPGNVVTCKLNAHRTAWNGTICPFPTEWNCGAKEDFRANKCDRDMPRCFHMNVFRDSDPLFVADWNGIDWVLHDERHQLDDQILLFWSEATREMSGVRTPQRRVAVGAYRVKQCEQPGSPYTWDIRPHADAWVRFPKLEIACPASSYAGGNYVRVMEGRLLLRLFGSIRKEIGPGLTWHDPQDESRFRAFDSHLEGWLQAAAESRRAFQMRAKPKQVYSFGTASGQAVGSAGSLADQLSKIGPKLQFREPGDRGTSASPSAVAKQGTAPPSAVSEEPSEEVSPLIGEGQFTWISDIYGDNVARAVAIGALTKPFLILRGPTGVGKSYLARHLVEQDRFLLVPVGATWRGREDLLGYVNPVTGVFEASPFTRFLERAARAWDEGNPSPWLVVFAEFNLSQPEHWLTDVLSLSQAEEDAQRVIELGGTGFEPDGGGASVTRVPLSRAVRFVATINNDHTVLPLSPRVLDRSSLVELPMGPHDAIRRAGVTVEDDVIEAITDLDYELRARGTTFSIRTAQSLRRALDNQAALGADAWVIVDHILCQEVLSKIRLHAGDPGDGDLLDRLKAWQENRGSRLLRCAELFEGWGDQLAHGADVIQA